MVNADVKMNTPDTIDITRKIQRQCAPDCSMYPPMIGPRHGPANGAIANIDTLTFRYRIEYRLAIIGATFDIVHDADAPASRRKMISAPMFGANAHPRLNAVKPIIDAVYVHLCP